MPAPLTSSSAGVGDALTAALQQQPKRIVLALGGSASTDGGAGMLAALGAVYRDAAGHALTADGGSLRRIDTVDLTGLPDLTDVTIVIASDVQNPLTGPDGAVAVYGPQKGADPHPAPRHRGAPPPAFGVTQASYSIWTWYRHFCHE